MKISRRVSRATANRDTHRSAAELDTLILTRELAKLSLRFPQHRPAINRLWWSVRFQLRAPRAQEQLIRSALARFDRLALAEIADETGLDVANVTNLLSRMIKSNQIELCSRNGERYRPKPGAPL